MRQLPAAVPQPLCGHTDLVEHAELQVGQRRFFFHANVPTALQPSARSTREQNREIGVQVLVTVADTTPKETGELLEELGAATTLGEDLGRDFRRS